MGKKSGDLNKMVMRKREILEEINEIKLDLKNSISDVTNIQYLLVNHPLTKEMSAVIDELNKIYLRLRKIK
jgi:hypothetical protein